MAAEHAEECTDGANDGVVCMYVTGDYTPTEDNQVCYIIKNSNDLAYILCHALSRDFMYISTS